MKIKWGKLLTKERAMYLAYDQGLEHGPVEFNDINARPEYIIEIAKSGKYNAVIFQKGIAEKYSKEIKASKVPLIIKLNGKTSLSKGEAISRQICSVQEAIALGARAVGYTIYVGSLHENVMMREFAEIEKEAHKKGLPVIAWIYPRGKGIEGKSEDELMEYSARIGLEIGADMVKLKYSGNVKALKFAVEAAGRCKIVVAGGAKEDEEQFLKDAKDIMQSGAVGMAIGRNIWQNDKPKELSERVRKIVFG